MENQQELPALSNGLFVKVIDIARLAKLEGKQELLEELDMVECRMCNSYVPIAYADQHDRCLDCYEAPTDFKEAKAEFEGDVGRGQ